MIQLVAFRLSSARWLFSFGVKFGDLCTNACPCGPPHERRHPEFRLTLRLNLLGKTPTAANWTSRNGNGEKSHYIMHESLNRSMHFALKETDCDQVRRGIILVESD
jgi:hypothetical protein